MKLFDTLESLIELLELVGPRQRLHLLSPLSVIIVVELLKTRGALQKPVNHISRSVDSDEENCYFEKDRGIDVYLRPNKEN